MTPAFVARCISEVMDEDAVIFNELGAPPQFMDLAGPNRFSRRRFQVASAGACRPPWGHR